MGEDLLRTLHKETIGNAGRLKQRNRYGLGLGLALQFVGGTPVRTARIEGVQNDVPTALVIELLDELTSRVINNRAMFALGDLEQDLADDGRLARPGVAYGEDVLVFGCPRNPQRSLLALNHKSDSIRFEVPGECARRDQHRPLDPAAIAQLETPPQVFADGERQLQKQDQPAPNQRRPEQVER